MQFLLWKGVYEVGLRQGLRNDAGWPGGYLLVALTRVLA
jgi:hypothetical protein